MSWNPKSRGFYESKGYIFTKYKDKFIIDINDLNPESHMKVRYKCDLCGKEYETEYRVYCKHKREDGLYHCLACATQEYARSLGIDNVFQLDSVKEKAKQTMLSKYGVCYNTQREEFKQQYLFGENNNFYVDGRNSNRIDRNTAQNKTWRRKLLIKFNKECYVCKANKKLEAHHIYSFEDNKELAYEVDNGVLLCKNCHTEFHKIYGFGNNNFDQLVEWFNVKSIDYRKDALISDIKRRTE